MTDDPQGLDARVEAAAPISDEELDYERRSGDFMFHEDKLKLIARLDASEAQVATAEAGWANAVDEVASATVELNEVYALVTDLRAQVAALGEALGELHFARAETMLDEEATIADDKDVEVEVMVCDHCFHLAHPEGLDDYCDPDVFWPCATVKLADQALGQSKPAESEEM